MEASGFLYYSPDPQGLQQKQHGHHGQFLPYVAPSPQLLAPTPIHFPSQLVLGGRGIPLSITPFSSPSLMESYASNDLCMESASSEIFINPATPPLTHSGLSTPSLPYAMATPISNHGWSSIDEPTITTVAPYEVQLPSTPMEYIPGLMMPTVIKSSASPAPSIALNDIHCPALSPCSSQTSFASETDFCDPRNLIVQSPTPVDCNPSVIFPAMSAVSPEADQFIFGQDLEQFLPLASVVPKPYITGDYNDELSDLECSEDEFIQSFEESVFTYSGKRVKYESDSENEQLLSPPLSSNSSRESSIVPARPNKQRKVMKKRKDSSDSSSSNMTEEERLRSFKFGGCEDHDHDHDYDHDHSPDSPCEKSSGIPINPHVIRRGRKQSLTEDPSKTFVCHLCNRRFRRQEHLKRHFRSLHTEDKPFSCGECGKKFSRSDNLTQHSRIHGTGSVVLGVLTEDEVVSGVGESFVDEPNPMPIPAQELGIVVVDALTAASGESKDQKSSEDKKARRKRKRSEE